MNSLRSVRREPLLVVALAGAVLFVVVGIGLPLLGLRSFSSADLLLRWEPYRSEVAPAGFVPTNICAQDPVSGIFPEANEFRNRVHAGDWPAWTTSESGGTLLASVPNDAFLSPISLPYYLLPTWLAPGYVKLLEMVACIGGMFLLLRRLGLSRASSVLGGAVFTSTGFLVTWTNWPQTRTAALIPWVFWAIERYAQERRWTAAAPISLAVAFMIFGGFPAVTGYTLYAAAIYAVVRCGVPRTIAALRRSVYWLVTTGVAVAIGAGVAAWQLLPFASQLGDYEFSRAQASSVHLPPITLATAIIPRALGTCAHSQYVGPLNDIETNVFIGVTALVLAVVAVVRRPPDSTPRGVRGYFVGATGLVLVLGWVGGGVLGFAQNFPVFSNNPIFRIRSVLGFFLAVLAAIGFENLQRVRGRRRLWAVLLEFAAWVAGACLVALAIYRVQLATRAYPGLSPNRYTLAIAATVIGIACVAVASSRRASGVRVVGVSLRTVVLAALPVMVLIESLTFVLPFWGRIPKQQFYPETSVHKYLEAHLGDDRYVAGGLTMFPGTSLFYGLNTPNGHAFTDPRWKQLLTRVDPNVFQSPTFSAFSWNMPLDRAQSPILDRLGAKALVLSLPESTYGMRENVGQTGSRVSIASHRDAVVAVPAGALRGVVLHVGEAFAAKDPWARIEVDVLDAAGKVLTTTARRTYDNVPPGEFPIAVAAETGMSGTPTAVRVRLLSNDPADVVKLSGSGDQPQLTLIRPANDGLRLVDVGGAAIYERLHAMPRIRWASQSRIVPNADERLAILANPASNPNVVLLEAGSPGGDGRPADVDVVRGDGDRIEARVKAEGSGYLEVADFLDRGWSVSVDGKRAELLRADHALTAVAVPRGEHVVAFVYHAPRARVGAALSVMSLTFLLAVGVFALRRRRRVDGVVVDDLDGMTSVVAPEPASS